MTYFQSFVTAILFSFIVLVGIYFLYKKFQPTTLIKKILKWFSVLAMFFVILVSALIADANYSNYVTYEKLVIPTGLDGIQLGWAKDEVLFRKGKPDRSRKLDESNGEELLEYKEIDVHLNKKGVIRIIHYCGQYESFPVISGVACDSPLEKVETIYGQAEFIDSSEDSLTRIYNYPTKQVAFVLKERKVKQFFVFDNKAAPEGYIFSKKKVEEVKPPSIPPKQKLPESNGSKEDLDHCAMNLTKEERLRRLALRGKVRETGLWKYSTGNHFLSFYNELGTQVANCW